MQCEVDDAFGVPGAETALAVDPYPGEAAIFSPNYIAFVVEGHIADSFRMALCNFLLVLFNRLLQQKSRSCVQNSAILCFLIAVEYLGIFICLHAVYCICS